MSSSRTSADGGKSRGPEEIGREGGCKEVKIMEESVETIERRTFGLSLDCMLTHCSLREECVGAPASQAGVGLSLRPGPASGEPSSACGSHR